MFNWLRNPFTIQRDCKIPVPAESDGTAGMFRCSCGHYSVSYSYNLLTTKTLCLACYSKGTK